MKKIIFMVVAIMYTSTYAKTFQLEIPKSSFSVGYEDLKNEFPKKEYAFKPLITNPFFHANAKEKTATYENSRYLSPQLNLKLVKFDKNTNAYTFILETKNLIKLIPEPNTFIPAKTKSADIRFTSTGKNYIEISGRFLPPSENQL